VKLQPWPNQLWSFACWDQLTMSFFVVVTFDSDFVVQTPEVQYSK